MAAAKILFVDDEDYVLNAICRFFRGVYDVQTASSADAALEILTNDKDFAVVVADVRMPGMSGIDFLRHAYEFAPCTTRVLLTGQLSTEDSLRAVNEGHIFQVLMKPCPVALMHSALEAAVRHHQNHQRQSALLEESQADGTVKMLCELLEMVSPVAASRASRIRDLAGAVAEQMGIGSRSEILTTALLSQFGCIGIPAPVLAAMAHGHGKLSDADAECFKKHPTIASRFLSEISQLRHLVRGIELQLKNYDGSGFPAVEVSGEDIPLASRILRAVIDFDLFTSRRMEPKDAIAAMMQNENFYDPKVLRALKELNHIEDALQLLELNVEDIRIGMILESPVGTTDGRTLLAKGSQVNESMLARLRAFARNGNLIQPILVSAVVPQVATSLSAAELATQANLVSAP